MRFGYTYISTIVHHSLSDYLVKFSGLKDGQNMHIIDFDNLAPEL